MRAQRRTYLAIVTTLAAAALVALPTGSHAQQINHNETGLPLYPHVINGKQYPAAQDPTTNGRWYAIYTAESPDSLAVVEAWYRRALPKAKETTDDNSLTHGIVLTIKNDQVLVYRLGSRPGAVIELHKFVRR